MPKYTFGIPKKQMKCTNQIMCFTGELRVSGLESSSL